jgi:glyoxylase-like metal-dependent hydrolase (beta-lactamase superfamily II)
MRTHFRDDPEDAALLPKEVTSSDFQIRPSNATHLVSHGEVIDLGGGQVLEVLHTPGHTPGSICLLDETNRMLFTGDTARTGPLCAYLDESDLTRFADAAQMLYSIGWDANLVLPAHGETPLDGGFLLELGSGFERLLDGEGMYEEIEWQGRTIYDVRLGRFSVRTREYLRKD